MFFYLPGYMFVFLHVCLAICLLVSLSVCLDICLTISLFVSLSKGSVCLSHESADCEYINIDDTSVCLYICLFVRPSDRSSFCLPFCLSVCLSVSREKKDFQTVRKKPTAGPLMIFSIVLFAFSPMVPSC